MSTTFKIIENHIENSKTSPKKSSIALASSQHLSPSSHMPDSDDGSQYDHEEVLKLEIKQLQRQNKFLKKKISQLTEELHGQQQQPKKKAALIGKGAVKEELDSTHMTVDFFFKQINNLMNSMADMFRVQFTNEQVKQFTAKFSLNEEQLKANKKYTIYKKVVLTRKLQKVSLETDERRYPLLLDIFTEYYKAKQQCDRYVRQTIDQYSARILQLNKMILGHASKRKNSMKGSCVKSQYNFDDTNQKNSRLTLPWTLRPLTQVQTASFTDEQANHRDVENNNNTKLF